MNSQCKCGGKMNPWSDNEFYFTWKCDACGVRRKQYKRKSTKVKDCVKCGHSTTQKVFKRFTQCTVCDHKHLDLYAYRNKFKIV